MTSDFARTATFSSGISYCFFILFSSTSLPDTALPEGKARAKQLCRAHQSRHNLRGFCYMLNYTPVRFPCQVQEDDNLFISCIFYVNFFMTTVFELKSMRQPARRPGAPLCSPEQCATGKAPRRTCLRRFRVQQPPAVLHSPAPGRENLPAFRPGGSRCLDRSCQGLADQGKIGSSFSSRETCVSSSELSPESSPGFSPGSVSPGFSAGGSCVEPSPV